MSAKRGQILIKLNNVQVADPGAEVRQRTDKGFQSLDNEQLVFVLHRLMLEMNRRSMILTDH